MNIITSPSKSWMMSCSDRNPPLQVKIITSPPKSWMMSCSDRNPPLQVKIITSEFLEHCCQSVPRGTTLSNDAQSENWFKVSQLPSTPPNLRLKTSGTDWYHQVWWYHVSNWYNQVPFHHQVWWWLEPKRYPPSLPSAKYILLAKCFNIRPYTPTL